MKREDIIRMAREAGFTVLRDEWLFTEMLECFAALVAAEKEKRIIDILERLHERCGESHNYYKHAIRVIKGEI